VQKNFGKAFRINGAINVDKVRVIDENGSMLGVIDLQQALELSRKASLDLVEVSPNVKPPVCKIANFGKMKYEMQKKASDSRKKQKIVETKEVKLSMNIGRGDYETKLKRVAKFIEKGDKVKVSIRMKGREMAHLDLADKMMKDVAEDIEQYAKFESGPRMEGRQMVGVVVTK
jgi:translation initiation factor IF-3